MARRLISWLASGSMLAGAACVPNTVGSMAQTAPVDEFVPALMWTASPMGFDIPRDSSLRYLAMDAEVRWGMLVEALTGIMRPGI